MNGVELSPHQTRMGVPFGSSDPFLMMNHDSNILSGSSSGGGTVKSTWPELLHNNSTSTDSATTSMAPSPNALYKMLAQLSYAAPPLVKTDFVPSLQTTSLQPSPSSFPRPRVSDQIFSSPIPYSPTAANRVRGALPAEFHSGFAHKDAVRHCPQHVTLNGGSLVLDTARGELVSASKMTPKELLEAKAIAASKSHSEAERRRRERINNHLATLRTLLPSSTKTDKASLLAEVIEQVKSLKRQVSDIYEYGSMPTDHDELSVEKVHSSTEGRILIRASLCCDDRPDLMTDLKDALDTLRLRTLKAEISTLGGRIKNVFIVTVKEDTEVEQEISEKRLQEALRLVMDGPGGGELSPGSCNKRQRSSSFENPAAGYT